jgi:hypothetical protein
MTVGSLPAVCSAGAGSDAVRRSRNSLRGSSSLLRMNINRSFVSSGTHGNAVNSVRASAVPMALNVVVLAANFVSNFSSHATIALLIEFSLSRAMYRTPHPVTKARTALSATSLSCSAI